MAQRLNTENAKIATLTGNERDAAIRSIIQTKFPELWNLDQRIAAMKAEHMKPLTDQRTKMFRLLKGDTDIANKVLKVRYAEYALAKEAQDFENEEETTKRLAEIRLSHAALHPGETVDWIAAINGNFKDPGAAAPVPAAGGKVSRLLPTGDQPAGAQGDGIYAGALKIIVDEGYAVGFAGADRTAHKYAAGSNEQKAFDSGWKSGLKQRNADAIKGSRPQMPLDNSIANIPAGAATADAPEPTA